MGNSCALGLFPEQCPAGACKAARGRRDGAPSAPGLEAEGSLDPRGLLDLGLLVALWERGFCSFLHVSSTVVRGL